MARLRQSSIALSPNNLHCEEQDVTHSLSNIFDHIVIKDPDKGGVAIINNKLNDIQDAKR